MKTRTTHIILHFFKLQLPSVASCELCLRINFRKLSGGRMTILQYMYIYHPSFIFPIRERSKIAWHCRRVLRRNVGGGEGRDTLSKTLGAEIDIFIFHFSRISIMHHMGGLISIFIYQFSRLNFLGMNPFVFFFYLLFIFYLKKL